MSVNDMDAMKTVYEDVLGLTPLESEDPDGWQEFEAGGVPIALHKAFDPRGKPASYNKICFYSDDVAATRQGLIDKGVKMRVPMSSGELLFADGEDPEGNTFQISNR